MKRQQRGMAGKAATTVAAAPATVPTAPAAMAAVLAAALALAACGTMPLAPAFSAGTGVYEYAPSIVQDEAAHRYALYCTNTAPYVIRDSIGLREARLDGATWSWGGEKIVLGPEGDGWDSVHVCDPDMVKGSFTVDGESYAWMMVYLGCDTLDNTHNQVGAAFAENPAGPWHPFNGNPIVSASRDGRSWGAGQPSVVSVDRAGRVRLFYTRGDARGTRMVMRSMDFGGTDAVTSGREIRLSTAGLTEADGSPVTLHGGALALGESGSRWWLIRERHPFPADTPSFIAAEEQVAWTTAAALETGGTWSVSGLVGPALTGAPRNHNGSIAKDAWGRVPDSGPLPVACSVSAAGPGFLWTYRVVEISVPRAR